MNNILCTFKDEVCKINRNLKKSNLDFNQIDILTHFGPISAIKHSKKMLIMSNSEVFGPGQCLRSER